MAGASTSCRPGLKRAGGRCASPTPCSRSCAPTGARAGGSAAREGARYRQLDLVFASSEGTPFQRNNLRRRHMVPVLEAAKLDKTLPLYALRHPFATLAGGLDPQEVSMMMAHSPVAFTQDKYRHVLPSLREATSQRLEKHLFDSRVVS